MVLMVLMRFRHGNELSLEEFCGVVLKAMKKFQGRGTENVPACLTIVGYQSSSQWNDFLLKACEVATKDHAGCLEECVKSVVKEAVDHFNLSDTLSKYSWLVVLIVFHS